VGENLQDHLQLRMAFRVSGTRTLNQQANSLLGRVGMGLQYFLAKRGPMTMSPSQLGCFAMSDEKLAAPDLEYHVQPLSLDKFGDPLHRFPAFTASVCDLRPASRGSVHIVDPDPLAAPRIAPNYLSTARDREVAAKALTLTRRIVMQPALRRYRPEEFRPGADARTEEELARAAGDIGTTIFHPVGTCKMAPQGDPGAVVDCRLRVHGVGGLRVVDASIMPTITAGNTNSPTIMIAEKGAHMIREDRLGLSPSVGESTQASLEETVHDDTAQASHP
jgi:choline dehydrogenase